MAYAAIHSFHSRAQLCLNPSVRSHVTTCELQSVDLRDDIFTSAQKLKKSQLNLTHGTTNEKNKENLKNKTGLFSRNGLGNSA